MRNCCHFLVAVMLAAGAGLVACSDDESSSSPLQPSPLAPAPAGAGPGGPSAAPVSLAAGDAPGLSRLAPSPDGFNAYDARIEYMDGEVTLTFDPVDMPRMPDAAREYRNRAVTVWHCPVEPHHVSQACGEPVFRDSFAFAGSPSRTFPLADCAGWLVVEAAELSADRYAGWRNAPLSCRTDEEGRTVADVDTGGGGAGWEDSRHDPPVRAGGGGVADTGPPVITDPGAMAFYPGETITPFPVTVTDPDGPETVTVTAAGFPTGLSLSDGMVSGTVSAEAAGMGYPVEQDYTVTVEATDGVNEPVTASFPIKVITTWVLLVDSFDATDRGNYCGFSLGRSGTGPDDSGWGTRWVRWYYDAGDRTRTITQAYSSGGFTGGGSSARGCTYTANCSSAIYTGTRRPNETDYTTGTGTQVLTRRDYSRLPVRRLDSMGNEIPRVPAGRAHTTDTDLNLWTVSFPRQGTHNIFTTRCNNNANWGGEIYYMNVPFSPSP